MNRPSGSEYNSVLNWMNITKPVTREESGFIREREDLVTLRPGRASSSFEQIVERVLAPLRLFKVSRSPVVKTTLYSSNMLIVPSH